MDDYKQNRKKVSDFWSVTREDKMKLGAENTQWLENKYTSRIYVNKTISGDPERNWLTYISEKYFKEPVGLGLSIGCGDGCLERHALKIDICKRIEAFDISEGAIKQAVQLIAEEKLSERVRYGVLDFNAAALKKNNYDVVFGAGSIHHIMNLEYLFDQVNKSLKKDGLFIINEFVGPSQFQWREKQSKIINDILAVLTERYKKSLDADLGKIKEKIEHVSREAMTQSDPSEAIRSDEIVPLFYRNFDVVERIDWGGTILQPLLHKIVGNFHLNDEKDKIILDLIILMEKTLIKESVISSDFVLLVGKKKTGIGPVLRRKAKNYFYNLRNKSKE